MILPLAMIASLTLASSASAATILVGDKSFEAPGFTGTIAWSSLASSPWTTGSGPTNSIGNSNYYQRYDRSKEAALNFSAASQGVAIIVLSSVNLGGSLTQNLLTTVNVGDKLTMTFYGGRAKSTSTAPNGGTFDASFDVGGTLYKSSFSTTSAADDSWTQFTLEKTITNSGILSLLFNNLSGNAWLDNLSDVSVTAIPEPSAALLGGLGMLALLRRRR